MAIDLTSRRLLRSREVAVLLGVHPTRVRALVRDGQLRSIRFGGEGWHRFDPREVERFLADRQEGAP